MGFRAAHVYSDMTQMKAVQQVAMLYAALVREI
jgi:hypothetical protein